jgi:CBS domain-containing protein
MRNMSDLVRDQNPLMLTPDTSVMEAARQMRERRVGAVLIAEGDDKLVGIFTGRDAVTRVLAEGKNPTETTLREVMTADPDTLTPRDNAIEALRLMQDCRCRHLPIVNEGRVAGIVSRGDFHGLELDRLDEDRSLGAHRLARRALV